MVKSDVKSIEFKADRDIEEQLMAEFGLEVLENIELQNVNDPEKPLNLSFDFEKENVLDILDNNIYLYPMMFLGTYENPFKLEDRFYPIDFAFPHSLRSIVNIEIPEGYRVSSIPEALKISLPDGLGSFSYKVVHANGKLNIMCNFSIKKAIVSARYYSALKEFFNQRVKKESEQVVLTKN